MKGAELKAKHLIGRWVDLNPRDFVKEYSIKSLVCCFSGGKDSLVATHYTLSEVLHALDLDRYVVFVNTGAALPGVVDYVREVADLYGWPLRILAPEMPFFDHALEKGMPTMRRRWCCYHCKLKPIIDFSSKLRPQRAEVTGLRREESKKRAKLPGIIFRKKTWTWGYAPIIAWTKGQVTEYIRRHKLKVNPNYRILKHSGECLCGVYSSLRELRIIRDRWPAWFRQFVELESQFRSGGAAFYLHDKPVYARDLWKKRHKSLTDLFE